MPFSPLDSDLFAPLFQQPEVAAVFANGRFLHTLLHIETTLAQVQAQLGIIPTAAAAQISAAMPTFKVDMTQMRHSIERAGVPVGELVRQLRAHVGPPAADYIHYGATTQDIIDTALVLQLQTALAIIEPQLDATCRQLATLADRHRHTLMAGRTHSQQALPITFGLKVAGWLAPLLRHRQRLAQLKPRLLLVQLGGAAGTLAALGERGTAVQHALATQLGLGCPTIPWHTQRDALAEFASWLSLLSGSLAKMGQDIILMAQSEIAELRETADPARGGSSTMPQKSNPVISELIIAAARTNAGLLGNMHQALVQEHERATHGWQMEWLTLPQMVGLTAAALDKAHFLSHQLQINPKQMRRHLDNSQGLLLAEAASFALAPHLGRSQARRLVTAACRTALDTNQHLLTVLRQQTAVSIDWDTLTNEAHYLGAAQTFIDQVLTQTATEVTSCGR